MSDFSGSAEYHVVWFEDLEYEWELCHDSNGCGMLIHHEWSDEEVDYPQAWLQLLAGFSVEKVRDFDYRLFYCDDDGEPHRDGGPALVDSEQRLSWYQHGRLHRVDGPAVEIYEWEEQWWLDGKRHRLDGPAVCNNDGVVEWWRDGFKHRVDGPAVQLLTAGLTEWWLNGKRHRVGGPAIERDNGTEEWWENGVRVATSVKVSAKEKLNKRRV